MATVICGVAGRMSQKIMLAAVVVKKDTTPRRSSVVVVKSVVIIRTSVAPAVIQTIYLENVLWEALHVSFVKAKIMCLHNAA